MLATLRHSRGVVLRKFAGRLDAAFHFAGALVPMAPTHRTPGISLGFMLLAIAALALTAYIGSLLAGDVAGLSMALVAPLVSKNRAANEFREKANKIRSELMDPEKELNREQVEKMTTDIATLEARAAAAAEFRADDEINRQGGEGNLVRVDAPNGEERERREVAFRTMKDAADDVRVEIRKAFPTIGSYLRAASGKGAGSEKESAVLKRVAEMTRAITGSDFGGEYLLPLTQVPEIFSVSNAQNGLMQYARRYSVPGRTLRIPYLIQDEGTTTLNRPMAGKIANVTIVGEGSTKPTREPTFGQRLLTIFKYAAVTPFGDEILADDFTGELPGEVTAAVGGQILNKMNEDITIDGGGTTEPVGALNAANTAILAVNRTTADSFGVTDAFAMYERHTLGPNSVWMVSRRVMSKLMAMTATNNGLVTWLSNLRDKPVLMLLGIPVVVTDLLSTLGDRGDVALVNGDYYAMGLRQALTVESSPHRYFEQDITLYRFIGRGGGIPLPTATYAYKIDGSGNKVDPHSPFTVLDVPASS